MNVPLDSEMQKFVDEKVASGEYASAKDVLLAALAALELQDAYGEFDPGELSALIAEGEQSIADNGVIPASDVFSRIRKQGGGGSVS